MQNIQFIYFDLDDTLLDHRHAERHALADVYTSHRDWFAPHTLADVQEVYHTINIGVWKQYALTELTKAEAKRARFARLLDALDVTGLDPDALSDSYLDRYSHYWRIHDGAEAAFAALAARYPVGILTNGFIEIQRAKLARFSAFRDRAASVVISEEVGHLKPHPKLFAHATAAAGVAPGAILYVGDSYHSDVQGATAAGWHVAWFTDADHAIPESNVFRFRDWPRLVAAVG